MLGIIAATQDNLKQIAEAAAQKYNVEPALVFAHIKQESNWQPAAYRAEPKINDASWGLMQVLLKTARGVTGNNNLTASELLNPEVNIDIGVRYIAKQLARYNGNLKDAIAAYNAGSSIKKKGVGTYINQEYVDKVYNNYLLYRGAQIASSPTGLVIMGVIAFGAILGFIVMRKEV